MNKSNRFLSSVKLIWEIPLSVCSWLYFKEMKFILGRLYTFALSRMTYEAHDWKVFNEETLRRPLVLPIIATKGPRWNTHAVIVTAGPLEVTSRLSIEVATAFASASSWSIVLYANPGYETVASIESFSVPASERWHDIELKPGKYSINLRYYGLSSSPLAPAVKTDDAPAVPPKPIPPDSNDFYQTLSQNKHWFYRAIHYYVFHMLRFRRWLPAAFVRREYLPVGDPGTIFQYGFITTGDCLQVIANARLIETYDVYLTLYNRSSFPVAYQTISDAASRTEPATTDGFYLFRIRRKAMITEEFQPDWLAVETFDPSMPETVTWAAST
jgi:Family of unknown function (DUF6208)